jgi:hypothetical protein
MALTTTHVFDSRQAAKYDGTNSADFNNEITSFTIVSENAQGLTFNSGGQQYVVAPGGWIVWYQGDVTEVFQNDNDFSETYVQVTGPIGLNHVHTITTSTGQAVQA